MGDDSVVHKVCSIKALLGIIAGAGASYGIYKLLSRGNGAAGTAERVTDGSECEAGAVQPGTLRAKVSGLSAACRSGRTDHVSSSTLELHHVEKLLSMLQARAGPTARARVLITLGNVAAFSVNQNFIRELGGIHIIAGLLSDPVPEIQVQTLNVLNNLSMNVTNQKELKVYVPQILELIEISPVNSDLQLACLRLLTNLSVTNYHQHLLSNSVHLFLSLLVVSSETLKIQVLKVLVNLSSNPDMIEDILQAQAPASLVLLFDSCTHPGVLQRLLTFVENLKRWHHLLQDGMLRCSHDSVYHVLLAEASPLQGRLLLLLAHPDDEVKTQVARLLT